MNRLVLIDGNAILHRAFHALPTMINSKGQHTNAVYGFIGMLITTINQLKPTHLIVAFDRPKPTFRKKLYKKYQAHRPKMDDILSSQVVLIHNVIEAMKIPIFEVDGYEADDVIGTLSTQCVKEAIDEAIVVTGDRDLLQLVNKKVKLFMPIKGLSEAKLFGEAEAEERMGVPPKQIADLKGLMGDQSDNYSGVAGIGPKTAVNLLKEFGTVEGIYRNIAKVKNPAVAKKLIKDKENALLSQKLATVVVDVPISFDINDAEIPNFVTQEVLDTFGDLEFKTLLKRLLKVHTQDSPKPQEKPLKKNVDDQLGLF